MVENLRIPELPSRTSKDGSMVIPIYRGADDITYGMALADLLPETQPDSDEWDSTVTYDEGDIRSFEDQVWISQQDNNLDNPPSDPGSLFWTLGVKSPSGLVPYQAGIFAPQYVTVLKQNASLTWSLYYLANATRPYNSTNFATELAAGDWRIVRDPAAIVNCDDLGAYTGGAGSDEYPDISNGAKGTGEAGVILKNNEFTVPAGGVTVDRGTGAEFVPAGVTFRALVNNPGSTPANWKSY